MKSSRVVTCIGAVAGVLAAAGSAQAAIVYNGVLNLNIPNTATGVYIDVNGGFASSTTAISGWDINIFGTGTTLSFAAPGGAQNFMRYPGVTTGSAGNLPIVTHVDDLASYGSGAVVFGSALGNWTSNGSNYFGFRFNAGTATYYGWGRISINGVSGVRTLHELAYENAPGIAICVGAVPTPGAAALLGLAGIAGRRRRR